MQCLDYKPLLRKDCSCGNDVLMQCFSHKPLLRKDCSRGNVVLMQCISHKPLLRKDCSRGNVVLRQCINHKSQTDENNASEHLRFTCPVDYHVMPSQTLWNLSNTKNRHTHTPSIAFRHLPPNSAITGYAVDEVGLNVLRCRADMLGTIDYATEGALCISEQLSTDAVSALQNVWVLIIKTMEAAYYESTIVSMKRVRPG